MEDTRRHHVVTVGEVLVDLIAPDAPDLEGAEHFIRAAGGAPANVAAAVARLGGRSALVSAVGDDPFGHLLRALVEAYGVDARALKSVPEPTTIALVASNRGGIPNFVFYRGADRTLSPADVPPDLIARSAALYLSSMALLGEPSREATLSAARIARDANTIVCVDPNLRPSSWPALSEARRQIGALTDLADIVKVNEEEAAILTGEKDPRAAATSLGGRERLVLVTLGARGCLWSWRGRSGVIPAPAVTVVDSTGAGDAFVGALLAELTARAGGSLALAEIESTTLQSCIRFACAAAALSCTRAGAMPSLPSREDVEQLLSE